MPSFSRGCFWRLRSASHLGSVPPEDIVHSFVLADAPHAILRTCVAITGLGLLLWRSINDSSFFVYFTNLNFTALAIYYILVATLTAHIMRVEQQRGCFWCCGTGDTNRHGASAQARLDKHWRILEVSLVSPPRISGSDTVSSGGHAHSILHGIAPRNLNLSWCERVSTLTWILFELVATNAVFLTIVYWVLLYDGSVPSSWDLIAHGTNAVFVMLELSFNVFPFCWAHFLPIFIFDLVYMIFAWIYFGITQKWIYFFLNLTKPTAALFYPALVLFGFCTFAALLYLARLRNWVVRKRHESGRRPTLGVMLDSDQDEDDEDEEEASELSDV